MNLEENFEGNLASVEELNEGLANQLQIRKREVLISRVSIYIAIIIVSCRSIRYIIIIIVIITMLIIIDYHQNCTNSVGGLRNYQEVRKK